ncbi:MAG TPA: dihydrofolate reductase family protein [Bacteroidota bacterium]|nr:dihydrofolate reductase family protein [Bacteroidota bacterium]
MRKVMYAMSVSLDGYIEAANGDLSWSFPDEELHKHFNERESMIDTYLYGRRLYENMTAYWPTADENPSAPQHEIEYARIWKSKPKVVFSKTLDHVEWNSTLIRDNIADEVNRLKSQSGKDMSVGGAELASTFMQLGLIDEFWLYVHPIILGRGKPMFQQLDDKITIVLIETHTFSSGVVLIRYRNRLLGERP